MLRDSAPWWQTACTSCIKLLLVPVRKSWWREPMLRCWTSTSVSATACNSQGYLNPSVNISLSCQARIPLWPPLTAPWEACAQAWVCLHHTLAECTASSKRTPPGWVLALSLQSRIMWVQRRLFKRASSHGHVSAPVSAGLLGFRKLEICSSPEGESLE